MKSVPAVVLSCAVALFAMPAFAQTPATGAGQAYPVKPVRLIVGFSPGGGSDVFARLVGAKLQEFWGQTVLVENRAGASGTMGADAVAKSPPDGYTLYLANITPNAIAPSVLANLPYDARKDFAPITLIANTPNILIVHPAVAAKNVAELIALAKAKPGKLTYASSGHGSTQHIAAEMFKAAAGVNIVHVPFKGSGQAMTDLIAGNVDLNFDTMTAALPSVKTGKLRALAVTSAQRASGVPDLPTVAEAGLPGFEISTWYGLIAPAGTNASLLTKVQQDVARALQLSDMRQRFAELSAEPGGMPPAEFGAFMQAEIEKYARLVKQANIKAE
jgi:tripartite-type tricarboxylate transporter receptor subunit TctC